MTNEVVTASVTQLKHEKTQGCRKITGLCSKIDELLKAPDSSRCRILHFLQDVKQNLILFQKATDVIVSTVNKEDTHGEFQDLANYTDRSVELIQSVNICNRSTPFTQV